MIVLQHRPRLLDLFSGAGGAAVGYDRAGFDVTGVDLAPQKHYPFPFLQEDALEFVARCGHQYAAIHASPPCQGYSIMRNLPWLRDREYPLLIAPVRGLLVASGRPWVLENVMGAHLAAGWLCGAMFDLPFYRHRAFETNFFWLQPGHPRHRAVVHAGRLLGPRYQQIVFRDVARVDPAEVPDGPGKLYRDAKGSWRRQRALNGGFPPSGNRLAARQQGQNVGVGHAAGWRDFATAADLGWMTRQEATQAIPPAYTEYVGRALRQQLA